MSKYKIATLMAEKDLEFIEKIDKDLSEEDKKDILIKRFNYYIKTLEDVDKNSPKLLDDDHETRTLIED